MTYFAAYRGASMPVAVALGSLILSGCPSDPCLGLSNAVVEVRILEPYGLDGTYPAPEANWDIWLEEADRPCGDALPWSNPLELVVEVEKHVHHYEDFDFSCGFGAYPRSLEGPGLSWQSAEEAPLWALPGEYDVVYRRDYDDGLVAQGEIDLGGGCTGRTTLVVHLEVFPEVGTEFAPAVPGLAPPWRALRYFEPTSSCDAVLGALEHGYCVDAFAADVRITGRNR